MKLRSFLGLLILPSLLFLASCATTFTVEKTMSHEALSPDPGPQAEPAPVKADPVLEALLDSALADGYTYDKLGELCDVIGHRLVGSPGMKRAIEWSVRSMEEAGFDSVWTEPVTVPYWTRGNEWARCTAPTEFDLDISGMGLSDGTGSENPNGIEAEILAVRDFDELEARADEAVGKIVLFNPPWEGYGKTVQYRVHGASRAAKHGAVAALIRSVTGVSLGAPHTGMMHYAEDVPRIPIAALTVEDAGRLFRLARRGLKPRVRLYMEAENHDDTISYNVIGDIRGREKPEEIVLLGGHLDSWDVGTCAHDDGAGVALAMGAARHILQQGLRPRRTVRVVHFTCEEMGGVGGQAYLEAHRAELDDHILALESDSGAFAPRGFSVQADSIVIRTIANLAAPLARVAPDDWIVSKGGSGVDVGPIVREGVPGVGHRVEHSRYFDVHHSLADTFEKIDPDLLARNVAVIAGLVYTVAENPASLGSDPSVGGP
ncbi:MAG: M20/M25/M40 family metallo-hydrolase [Gemmatimonadales bacterium]|nr:M20/M25/M40 family metallo-hydrolase [Gemmatimonadales bacterium]